MATSCSTIVLVDGAITASRALGPQTWSTSSGRGAANASSSGVDTGIVRSGAGIESFMGSDHARSAKLGDVVRGQTEDSGEYFVGVLTELGTHPADLTGRVGQLGNHVLHGEVAE